MMTIPPGLELQLLGDARCSLYSIKPSPPDDEKSYSHVRSELISIYPSSRLCAADCRLLTARCWLLTRPSPRTTNSLQPDGVV